MLLCGRTSQADELLQKLTTPGDITISADSPDEVTAFAVAAIRKAPIETRLFLEARMLIVETEEAAQQLAGRQGLIFLPRAQARQASGVLARYGPTVVGMGGDQPRRNSEHLPRPTSQELGNAISLMGFPEDKAYQLARSCGRSVTILARMLGAPGTVPEWMPHGRTLVPALLAGGWDAASSADTDILVQLAGGKPYADIEAGLQPLVRLQDPPIDREDTVWKMRAPVDAFIHLGHLLGAEDLARLSSVAIVVFSKLEEPPDPNEPFRFNRTPPDSHTSWLRDGLATTLLQIATLQDQADLIISGKSGQQFVNEIVRSLPGLANDHRVIASLRDQLPLLAEAAPDPLLWALEHLLEGDGAAIRPIFNEVDQILAPTSYHTGVLWALETLAWEPTLLSRVVLILARLADIDPGGRLSNRPINSLRAIFIPFAPNTNASLQLRLAALDLIIRQVPHVAWTLLLHLLPHTHEPWMPTARPKFRESEGSDRQVVTYAVLWENQREIITRVLSLAGDDAGRWVALVKALANFAPKQRSQTLELLDSYFSRAGSTDRQAVWSELRNQVNRNRAFADAAWALPEEELKNIDTLIKKYRPDDEVYLATWLFDDWHPDIPGNSEYKDEPVNEARREAVRAVLSQQGPAGVLVLAERAKLPQFVATAVGEVATELALYEILILDSLGHSGQLDHFATILSGIALQKFGEKWVDDLIRLEAERKWQPDATATLLLAWPDESMSWGNVSKFGIEVERRYWERKPAWIVRDPRDCEQAVHQYLSVGRAIAALDAIHFKINDISADVIFSVLDAAVGEVNRNPNTVHSMFTYHVEEAFRSLYKREGVPLIEIAKREYAYLPVLERQRDPLALHRLLMESPEFYVSVICDVFRPVSGEAPPPTKEVESRASAGYRLLGSLKLVPGEREGRIEPEPLQAWVRDVRRLGAESDRADITDQYVGHVLAHAPVDVTDQAWPDRAIRDVIEEECSTQLETGVMTERFNMRGAYSKALYEGGKQERALAGRYRSWAKTAASWPRTAALLERIAQGWEADARREDTRAEQDRLRD